MAADAGDPHPVAPSHREVEYRFGEMNNMSGNPQTFCEVVYLYHDLHTYFVSIREFELQRDRVLQDVETYLSAVLDKSGVQMWQVIVECANRALSNLGREVRRELRGKWDTGIAKPIRCLMEIDPTDTKAREETSNGRRKPFSGAQVVEYLAEINRSSRSSDRDRAINPEVFQQFRLNFEESFAEFVFCRDDIINFTSAVVSRVRLDCANREAIKKAFVLPLELLIKPNLGDVGFGKPQLPLPNVSQLAAKWGNVSGDLLV